jgi:hypothetical protein
MNTDVYGCGILNHVLLRSLLVQIEHENEDEDKDN